MMRAGWVRVFEERDGIGRRFEWSALGIQRARELHVLLSELGYIEGRMESHRVGEYDFLIEFVGDCISQYGEF
jgi:hypothetical protein